MKNIRRKAALAALVAGLSFQASAQVPVVGDLVGGGIPVLGDVTGGGLPLAPLLQSPQSLLNLGESVLTQPQDLLGIVSGLGAPLFFDFVPIAEVLATDPASLPDFLGGGGTVLTGSLALVPSIPLLTSAVPAF